MGFYRNQTLNFTKNYGKIGLPFSESQIRAQKGTVRDKWITMGILE